MNDQNAMTVRDSGDESPLWLMRRATDVAGVCKEIVTKTAMQIQGRKYVKVEGWQSIATANGCVLSTRDVEETESGIRAIADVKRMVNGAVICSAEGFVSRDETTWYGGEVTNARGEVSFRPKRSDAAIRAMAQTRAMSRAARAAFAFVVVLMDAGLETVPAEEVEGDDSRGFGDDDGGTLPKERKTEPRQDGPTGEPTETQSAKNWRAVELHFGKNQGMKLGALMDNSLRFYCEKWEAKPYPAGSNTIKGADLLMSQALDAAALELGYTRPPKTSGK